MRKLKSKKYIEIIRRKFFIMIQKLREILEKQSTIISKQKKLILKLNDELRKRNLKSEEVALVLQGVTLGLKNARIGYHFWPNFDAQTLPFLFGVLLFSAEFQTIHAQKCYFGRMSNRTRVGVEVGGHLRANFSHGLKYAQENSISFYTNIVTRVTVGNSYE